MIFLNDFSEIINSESKVLLAILGFLASLLGFILTRLYDRFGTDKFLSKSNLLEKLQKQTLSKTGKNRLNEDLITAIRKLQNLFSISRSRLNRIKTIEDNKRFYAKGLDEDVTTTNCPEDSEFVFTLFYDTESISQKAIFDLDNLKDALQDSFTAYFKDKDTDKCLMQNKNIINENLKLIFWINVLNYVPESITNLNDQYNKINNLLKKHIPGTILIFELYINVV